MHFHFWEKELNMGAFIARGKNTETPTIEGEYPLHRAASAGTIPVVQDLLAKGAAKDGSNELGQTPLIVAVTANHLQVGAMP